MLNFNYVLSHYFLYVIIIILTKVVIKKDEISIKENKIQIIIEYYNLTCKVNICNLI